MKLLLAEDEKDLSRALTAVLGHSGYEVDTAFNGQEAVEILEGIADIGINDQAYKQLGLDALKVLGL